MKKILFVSDYAPTESQSGGLVMLDQLQFLSRHTIADVLVYNSSAVKYEAVLQSEGSIIVRSKLGENQPNIQSRLLKNLFESIFNFTILKPWLNLEAKKLQKLIDSGDYETVFITVQGLYLAKLVNKIRFERNQVVVQYWDPDAWWALGHNFSKRATSEIFQQHKILEESAAVRSILVPSEGMRKALTERSADIHKKIEVFYPSDRFTLHQSDVPKSFEKIRDQHRNLILFAGSIYALPEIMLFVETVNAVNREFPEMDLALVIIGPTPLVDGFLTVRDATEKNPGVYLLERMKPAEVDTCLSLADINFLPYPFWNQQLVEESFPSKFSKYVGAKKPILILAPSYSSLSKMLSEEDITIGLVTLRSKTNLRHEILRLIEQSECRKLQLIQLSVLQDRYFSKEIVSSTLGRVFKIDSKSENSYNFASFVNVEVAIPHDRTQRINLFIRRISMVINRRPTSRTFLKWMKRMSRFLAIKPAPGSLLHFAKRIRNYIKSSIYRFLIAILGQERYRLFLNKTKK